MGSPFTVSEPLAGHSHCQRSCQVVWKSGVGPLPELERKDYLLKNSQRLHKAPGDEWIARSQRFSEMVTALYQF